MDRKDFLKHIAFGAVALVGGGAVLPLVVSGCGRGTSEEGPVATPTGFTWTDHPLVGKLFADQHGLFSTTFDPTTRKYVDGATYYVDVASGSDINAGRSADSALQSIAAACAKSDVGSVMVKGYGVGTPYYRGKGFNNGVQGRHLNIIGYGDDIPYITTHDVLSFTPASGQTYTYQATRASVTECMDMVGGAPGVRMTKVTGLAACEALAGSWYQDGRTLYLHATDSRNLATTDGGRIWALLNVPNFKNAGDYTSYLENLVLYGGIDCVNASGATSAGGSLAMVNVETGMSGAHGGNNVSGWGVDSVLVNCATSRSGQDGYNYHALNGKSPHVVEINCRATDCGHGTSDQCSTAHDGAKIIRVGGTYRNAFAANVADINGTSSATESWNLGCLADGAGDGFANWQCGDVNDTGTGPKMWLDGCDSGNADSSTATYGRGEILARGSRLEHNRSEVTSY